MLMTFFVTDVFLTCCVFMNGGTERQAGRPREPKLSIHQKMAVSSTLRMLVAEVEGEWTIQGPCVRNTGVLQKLQVLLYLATIG